MRFSLFLDLDGTLIDLAAHPDAVTVPPRLVDLLSQLDNKLQGAMAIVSGRPITALDKLLSPYHGPAVGIHGAEHRQRDRPIIRQHVPVMPPSLVEKVQHVLIHESSAFIEHKGATLAVHHRRNQAQAHNLENELHTLCINEAPEWALIAGHQVFEIKPRSVNKGTGVSALMQFSPFAGSCPIAIGDDITDLDLFAAARQHGGLTIAVGSRLAGKGDLQLASPAEVMIFLTRFLQTSTLQNLNDVAALAR